jgi:predicted adenylyl cyclase CyaB
LKVESKINVEIKARCADPRDTQRRLQVSGARYVGLDRQKDTYFRVADGRLKLRQGNIENSLIFYRRIDGAGPRPSQVRLHRPQDPGSLHHILTDALEVDVVVEKRRYIYFLENVKVHVDSVTGLGHFLEVEAIGDPGPGVEARLEKQCREVMNLLAVRTVDLVDRSYSDMLRAMQTGPVWKV